MALNQDKLDYMVNMVESGDSRDWGKAVCELNENVHPDTLRKAFNVSDYSGYEVYKFMKDKMNNNFMSDEEIVILDTKKDELYKERVKLQDCNREKRKYLREESRIEMLKEYIADRIEICAPIQFTPCSKTIDGDVEASVLISDLHCGAIVDNVFNYFDSNILQERLEELTGKIISVSNHENVSHLNIEILGDSITGVIHGSTVAEANEDVIDQVLLVSELLSNLILKVRENIPSVSCYITFGNHGRVSKGKSDFSNRTNFEKFISTLIKKEIRDSDVKVFDGANEDFITYKLKNGSLIVCTHGTNDNPQTAKKNFTELLKEDVYEVHMGHYHEYKVGNGTIINGSVMGSDEFAISIRKNSKPTQIMKVYRDGFKATYELELY